MTIPRILVVALAVFFECYAPQEAMSGAVLSFIVGALVGGLKPFWFTDTVRGRKPGEKFTHRTLAEVKG